MFSYQFHIRDYLTKTSHLSETEDLAYRRLLDLLYTEEAPLPTDVEQCARKIRMRDHAEIVGEVLREFFDLRDDGWHNDRAEFEIARYHGKSQQASAAAKASVDARARGKAARNERMKEARAKGTHTEDEWQALVLACGSKCVNCLSNGPFERDHIVLISDGGSDAISNIQPLCRSCNASKGTASVDLRPRGWQADVERTLNERSTDVQPTSKPKNQEPKKKNNTEPPPSPEVLFPEVDANVLRDFMAVRKKKGAPLTETAAEGIRREAKKAGWSVEAVMRECAERGWTAAKADWLAKQRNEYDENARMI